MVRRSAKSLVAVALSVVQARPVCFASPNGRAVVRIKRSMTSPELTILLASPRGFCAGVERAIEIVEQAIEQHGPPVYVRHEIVHNRHVVDRLRAKGAVFVEELDEVPDDALVVFSAHGVPKEVPAEAQRRQLIYADATCPLVSKVHRGVEQHAKSGRTVLLIGHSGHPEVVGTMGQLPPGAIILVEDVAQAESLEVPDPDRRRLRHPDHAVGARDRGHPRGAEEALSRRSQGRAATTSAMPPPTGSGRSRRSRRRPI